MSAVDLPDRPVDVGDLSGISPSLREFVLGELLGGRATARVAAFSLCFRFNSLIIPCNLKNSSMSLRTSVKYTTGDIHGKSRV